MTNILTKLKKSVNENQRIIFVSFIFFIFFGVVILRLTRLQISENEKYQFRAKRQVTKREIIKPPRGIIFDRNMNPLVTNMYEYKIDVYPKYIANKDSIATLLSGVFQRDAAEYKEKFRNAADAMFTVEKISGITETQKYDSLKIDGVIIQKTPYRFYNYGELASQVIGYTTGSNEGAAGLELAYEEKLAGSTGLLILQRDAKGNKRPFSGFSQKYPESGKNIVLSIDINLQKIAEEELKSGVGKYGAKGGRVLILSVNTGEILAMATYPTYNPNSIREEDANNILNRVISDRYEPGSVYKLVTIAGGLEENLINKETEINTENGQWKLSETRTITDEHKAASMSVEEVVINSSNIGTGKIARMLGKERQFNYARKFGIGTYTGIETVNETRGDLKHPSHYEFGSLEWIAMGYEISVNFLQIAMAYNTVANNGILLKPILVRKILSHEGNIIAENKSVQVRQVISPKTSKTLTECFRKVTESGTATDAKIEGVNIAGKTGTTQNGKFGYSSGSHNSSFIGYFPAEKPSILVAVFMDEMVNTKEFYGGKTSAPVFRNISERVIKYVGTGSIYSPDLLNENFDKAITVNATVNDELGYFIMPDFSGKELENVKAILTEKSLKFEIKGYSEKELKKGDRIIVSSQFPKAGDKIYYNKQTLVKIETKRLNPEISEKTVPLVTGLSIRKAVNILIAKGYSVEIIGYGFVDEQIPESGKDMPKGSKIKIFCSNKN